MAMSPDRILDMLTAPTTGGLGVVEAARRFSSGNLTAAERALIEEVKARHVATKDAARGLEVPAPPWGRHVPSSPRKQPLSAADLMWLDRLPRDSAEITEAQAKDLAKLAAQVEANSGDARLVDSIFGPVRARFEAATAKAELERLRALAPPRPPSNAVVVLAEAIARSEAPAGLDADAAYDYGLAQARSRLGAAIAQRDAEYEAKVAAVEARGAA